MASLNHLSDEELRVQLKLHGIDAPVTSSTRNILLKKLNHSISSRAINTKKGSKPSKKINSASTNTIKTVSKGKLTSNKNRAQEFANHGSILNSYSSDEDGTDPEEESLRPRRALRNNSFLDSSQNVADETQTTKRENSFSYYKKPLPIRKTKSSYLSSPLRTYLNSPPKETQSYQSRSIQQDLYDTGSDSDIDTHDDTDSNNKSSSFLMNRLSGRNNIFSRDSNKTSQNSSYDFGSRISNSFRTDLTNGNDLREEVEITSPDDIVAQESFISTSPQLVNGQSPFNTVKKSHKGQLSWDITRWLPSVPILLLILFALFFCILGFCYISINVPILSTFAVPSLNMGQLFSNLFSLFPWKLNVKQIHGSSSDIDAELQVPTLATEMTSKFPICKAAELVNLSCLSRQEAEGVPDLLLVLEKTIRPLLLNQAKSYQCGVSQQPYLNIDLIAAAVLPINSYKSKPEMIFGLKGLGKLTRLHPTLGIDSVWEDNETLLGLAVKNPPREILCHLVNALYNFIHLFIAILSGFFVVFIALKIFQYKKRQNEEKEQQCFELVERILEVLEKSCGSENQEYVAVNHVRDCFIPPRERKAKSELWKRAVSFIDNHDSRVYREVRSVGGEDTDTWRWVYGVPKTPPDKMWQGQAFDSLENTQNLPQVSPTSCLKIRNMFDSDIEFSDNWPRRIQDSLLEKCEGIDIVHVAVDKLSKEGCVYVKCLNTAEAGKAYRSLHGWWFDGHLVTVKYLRDERYHERFPSACDATSPMKPSNNQRLSLQTDQELKETPNSQSTRRRSSTRTSSRNLKNFNGV